MTKTLETKLAITSWDEKPYREEAEGRKFTHAQVVLDGTDDAVDSAAFESLMYYAADGTSTYVTLMEITGTLDDRSGSLVLAGRGTFDGTTAAGEYDVIAGTGELEGITGSGESASTHADYPNMPFTLRYALG